MIITRVELYVEAVSIWKMLHVTIFFYFNTVAYAFSSKLGNKKFRQKYLYSLSFKIKQQGTGRGCSMIHDGPVYDRP